MDGRNDTEKRGPDPGAGDPETGAPELTPQEVRALEPGTPEKGGYNVRWHGKLVKRGSRDYYRALEIEPPTWAEIPEEEKIDEKTDAEILVGKTRTVKHPGVYHTPKTKREVEQAAAESAAVILTLLNAAVGMAFGEIARMTPEEQRAIEEPLGRIMARMSPTTNALISKWTDPIMLLTAVFAWGARVYVDIQIEDAEEPPEGPGPSDELPTITPSDNGNEAKVNNTGSPQEDLVGQINKTQAGIG